MASKFTAYQGPTGCTSFRASVELPPNLFSEQFSLNRFGDAYEFSDGEHVFTIYGSQGFSEDREMPVDWTSVKPTKLHVGASLGTPRFDIASFIVWLDALYTTYKATHAEAPEA